jgi:hypothetical protein
MRSNKYTVSVSMTKQEKRIIEFLSKQSKISHGEMIRFLLFETGILQRIEN